MNDRERLIEILDAEFMWSKKCCKAVADYLIGSGLGFVDEARKSCGSILAAKDVIINDLNEENNRLRKENVVLWKKQEPVAVENERCPVCGVMVFVQDKAYCRCCGQLLQWPKDGDILTDDTEVGMLANLNDRM